MGKGRCDSSVADSCRKDKSCSEPKVFFGDTASAAINSALYLSKGYSNVHWIVEGTDAVTTDPRALDITYPLCTTNVRNSNFNPTKVFYLNPSVSAVKTCSSSDSEDDGADSCNKNLQVQSRTLIKRIGYGVSGDLIQYAPLDLFPMLSPETPTDILRFFKQNTLDQEYSKFEKSITCGIKEKWQLGVSDQPTTRKPAVTYTHRFVMQEAQNCSFDYQRNLFSDEYLAVADSDRASVYLESRGIHFDQNDDGTYDVNFRAGGNAEVIHSVKPSNIRFSYDPISSQRIATEGGLPAGCVKVPSEYRASVPVRRNIVKNLKCTRPNPVSVYGSGGFSLYNIDSSRNGNVVWGVYWHFSDIDQKDQSFFDTDGGTIGLIVEAINLSNTRNLSYNTARQQAEISFNSPEIECKWTNQFKKIVSGIHEAATGSGINVDMYVTLSNAGKMVSNDFITNTPEETVAPATYYNTFYNLNNNGQSCNTTGAFFNRK